MIRRRVVAGIVVVLAGTLLTSCAAPRPIATPDVLPSRTSTFESRDDASQQFQELYHRYIGTTNSVTADGGARPERLKPYLTPSEYAIEAKSMNRYADSKLHVDGGVKIAAFKLQAANLGAGTGSAYVCLDVSATRVIDSGGKDVTSAGRLKKQDLLVEFAVGPRISASRVWAGDGVC